MPPAGEDIIRPQPSLPPAYANHPETYVSPYNQYSPHLAVIQGSFELPDVGVPPEASRTTLPSGFSAHAVRRRDFTLSVADFAVENGPSIVPSAVPKGSPCREFSGNEWTTRTKLGV